MIHCLSFSTAASLPTSAPTLTPSLFSSPVRSSHCPRSTAKLYTACMKTKHDNNLTIYDIILSGTHDSAAYISQPNIPSRLTEQTPLIWRPLRSLTSTLASEFALTQTHSILQQLRNGARFLDLRITKPASTLSEQKDIFWTHHGIVLCVPLIKIIEQINAFHSENENQNIKQSIILVFRDSLLSKQEQIDLSAFIYGNLTHSIYNGNSDDLRNTSLLHLSHNILVGLHHSNLPLPWGKDIWIDTYNSNVKIDFLQKTLLSTTQSKQRNNLLVLGWTITPSVVDIVLRVLSFGFARSPLLPQASSFNSSFPQFRMSNSKHLQTTANVIFFDAFDSNLAQQVHALNQVKFNQTSQLSIGIETDTDTESQIDSITPSTSSMTTSLKADDPSSLPSS